MIKKFNHISEYLTVRWWTALDTDSEFMKFKPPQDFWFSEDYFLSILKEIDEKYFDRYIKEYSEIIAWIYDIKYEDLCTLFFDWASILAIRIADEDNKNGSINLWRFEYIIQKIYAILLKTAGFVIENKPQFDNDPLEANKYINYCNFLQTAKGSFISRIALPSEEIIKPSTLFAWDIKGKDITDKFYNVLNFVNDTFFDQNNENINLEEIVKENPQLINVNILKEVKMLYQHWIKNIEFSILDKKEPEIKKTQPKKIEKKNIDILSDFISGVEENIRHDEIDSYWIVSELESKDPSQDETNHQIVVIGTSFWEDTKVCLQLDKQKYYEAIEAHKSKKTIKIRGKVMKLKTQVNIIELYEFKVLWS